MKTSLEWWNETKSNQDKLINWLKNQYHGEKMAATNIRKLFLNSNIKMNQEDIDKIEEIAKEEELHAKWIKRLLISRDIEPMLLEKESRYWNEVLEEDKEYSLEELSAIAHLAEKMRLERIRVISNDMSSPKDIRLVFTSILTMELKHEAVFKSLSNNEEIDKALLNHNQGLNALGLVI